ncbi:hypothetical protein ACNTMW_31095 [Planosporangium sp. 12N6]|uniref:hypothetical protein n=1 Tax=Planosporangium spinosum TaxID=3402278 RepID=UPI003CE88EE6
MSASVFVDVETTRAGQLRVALPEMVRRPYATGQQVRCVRCVEHGVDRLGVSRDGPGSPALCLPCWRSLREQRLRRERREFVELVWEGIGEAQSAAACQACGAPEPVPDCWLCGYSWLAEARAQFERDQAAAAAAEAAECARIAARTEAEAWVADVAGWVERLQATLTAYVAGGGRGRAVELVADLLARQAAARSSARGRPSVLARVGAVLAVDSDWRSGRRAMPGRERTAELAGCSARAVSSAWRQAEALGWATRTGTGGRLSLAERVATGRANSRSQWDLAPLHRGDPTAREGHLQTALELLGELLEHALDVLGRAQGTLDELRARTGRWTDWPERARRARLRQAVAQTRTRITTLMTADQATNICTPHMVSTGMSTCSCSYWGLRFSPHIMIHSERCAVRPRGGRGKIGASRSTTRGGRRDLDGASGRRSPRLTRPRTPDRWGRRPQPRPRPAWACWATHLARELVKLWPWLARVPRPRVVATLGARLGPDWTATTLARWVTDQRARPVLADPVAPLAYLRALLDNALAGAVTPPHPARTHDEHRRQVAAAAGAQQMAGHARLRAEFNARDDAAAAATGAGRAAARAELARIATRRAERRSPLADCDWPEVAQPGSGPPGAVRNAGAGSHDSASPSTVHR